MRKAIFALALFFCADVAVDNLDVDCARSLPSQSCHACLCQTPAITPGATVSEKVELPRAPFVTTAFETYSDRLFDKSLFQPPKALT